MHASRRHFTRSASKPRKKTACSNGNSNNGSDEGGKSRKRLAMLKDAVVAAKAELAVAKRFVIEKRQCRGKQAASALQRRMGMKTEKGVAGKCLRTTTTRRKRRPGKHAFVGTKGGRLITKLRVLGVEEQRALCKNRISSAIVCRTLVRKMEESEKEVTEGRRRRR